ESTSSSGALEDLMKLTETEAKVSQERLQFMKEKKAEGYTIEQINRAWIKKQRDDADELGGKVEFLPSAQYKNAAGGKVEFLPSAQYKNAAKNKEAEDSQESGERREEA
ncbi:unnamed protein product, partial [Symbiodinium microadriaticum]